MSKKYEARIRGLLQSHICTLIESQLNDPRVIGITITDVEVTQDTRYAKVFYSMLGSAKDKQNAARGLDSAAGWVSHELGRRLRTKNTPHITFVYDPSLERGEHMAHVLDEVKQREAQLAAATAQTVEAQPTAPQEASTSTPSEPEQNAIKGFPPPNDPE
jgi:ribosome-binding factor A